MYQKKECVAMLLAGGQGSRLHVLTSNIAKPAVPFGGKYRIIDFPLSNCVNSGIDTVGVLTQYEPHSLNAYIGNGQPWDLDRLHGGVYILPPYQHERGSEWYMGTANAIYQNIAFVDGYHPEYLLVLSGDHIYKMDYSKMIAHHKEKDAAATIAVIDVPREEASRFGIMSCDETGRIVEFHEKPKEPKGTLASMGIYVFNWPTIKEYLRRDNLDPSSTQDFGKDVIPTMLRDGLVLSAYRYDGYWKDVGTIESLWQANMDLLKPNSGLSLADESWKIYGRNMGYPPHFAAATSRVADSLVAEGCEIYGSADRSVLFGNVTIGKNAVVERSVLMPGVVVEEGAEVHCAIVAERARIRRGAVVGERDASSNAPYPRISVVAADVVLEENGVLKAGDMLACDKEGSLAYEGHMNGEEAKI